MPRKRVRIKTKKISEIHIRLYEDEFGNRRIRTITQTKSVEDMMTMLMLSFKQKPPLKDLLAIAIKAEKDMEHTEVGKQINKMIIEDNE